MAIIRIRSGKSKRQYRVRIQPVDPVTKKIIKVPSRKAATRTEAVKLERKMWAEYQDNKLVQTEQNEKIFATELANYVKNEYEAGRWSQTTYTDWLYTSRLVNKFFGRAKLRDIDTVMIRKFARHYIATHDASVGRHTTIDRRLQHLRTYFSVLVEGGLAKNPVPKNPLRAFFRYDEFSIPETKYTFSDDEVSAIKVELQNELLHTNTRFWSSKLAILVGIETGMRPQEIQALRWDELIIDGSYYVFKIDDAWNDKTHQLNHHLKGRPRGYFRKTVSVSANTVELLKTFHKKQQEYLAGKGMLNSNNFIMLNLTNQQLTKLGYPINQRSMNDLLKKVAKKVEVNNGDKQVTMYTCRHTVASKLANTPGMKYPWAANRLGHSVDMFLRTYVHVDQDKDEEMLDLINANTRPNTQKLKTL
ncbi:MULTISPECIES: tyrosine-type recombinase/integrase [Lactobacillus]|uniref:tyrosine-type recombinase/integrase n=1 Tax=Lactobacillus TaxID=1578 RepID=UPI0021A36DA9|nr:MULTISPECIES: tyrosine-type recombinase/integrase [Lactobacillus]MCT3541303.1 integrase [Lactobacillus crispatus]MCT3595195.1 integrase [Lactobacillus amylovorus]MDB6240203.1 tyrosine-type recombinase/integrase [Lactobacillus amylovorus]